ncbi:ribonuclease HII [Caminibacter mediatlanticus TB-2]|uniref:Ribonuclease HII n=1 Tax=Caminibacter mediatlanticus TB-2 TaxID=391592 RepID=A0ABX5V697_9BACT|nr:ribonuclease HII [Caminibacter mediatlanticus]QCT93797.1 ribonuclease HII [Caminibacter mediatlanticus TB-2]
MDICGIDEAGRGPIAGPLVMAGVMFLMENGKWKMSNEYFEKLTDSKKLSPKKREELFEVIKENSIYHIVFIDNETIDKKGLSFAIKFGLNEIISKINAKEYLFDGNTNFGIKKIKPIIKGDLKIKEISAASILAKVSRDRYMIEIDKIYPEYNFKKHKGYITKEHINLIKKYGFSDIHRKSYKLKALEPTLF